MHRTDASGNNGGLYTEGDSGSGTPATRIGAKHLNAIQGELCNLVELLGGVLDDEDDTQIATILLAALALKAPMASPALTGTPTVPTASPGTDTDQAASTAFVQAAVAALVAAAPGALDTLNELAAALGNDADFATTVTNALAAKAPLASPQFTGTPKGPGMQEAVLDLGTVTGTTNVDVSAAGIFTATVDTDWTPTFTDQPASGWSKRVLLRVTNGGAAAITWPTIAWAGGFPPALAEAGVDEIELVFREGSAISGRHLTL